MGSGMVVVFDEVGNLRLRLAGQGAVFEQDAVLERLMPTLDLALRLRMARRTADVGHAPNAEPVSQVAGDVARLEQPVDGRFRDEGAARVGEAHRQLTRTEFRLLQSQGNELLADLRRRAAPDPARPRGMVARRLGAAAPGGVVPAVKRRARDAELVQGSKASRRPTSRRCCAATQRSGSPAEAAWLRAGPPAPDRGGRHHGRQGPIRAPGGAALHRGGGLPPHQVPARGPPPPGGRHGEAREDPLRGCAQRPAQGWRGGPHPPHGRRRRPPGALRRR